VHQRAEFAALLPRAPTFQVASNVPVNLDSKELDSRAKVSDKQRYQLKQANPNRKTNAIQSNKIKCTVCLEKKHVTLFI